jgi:hypothetical protein
LRDVFVRVSYFVAFFLLLLVLLLLFVLFIILFFVLVLILFLVLRSVRRLATNKKIVGLSAFLCRFRRLVLLRRHHHPLGIFRKVVLVAEVLHKVLRRARVLREQAKAISSARTWLKTAAKLLVSRPGECSCRCEV